MIAQLRVSDKLDKPKVCPGCGAETILIYQWSSRVPSTWYCLACTTQTPLSPLTLSRETQDVLIVWDFKRGLSMLGIARKFGRRLIEVEQVIREAM